MYSASIPFRNLILCVGDFSLIGDVYDFMSLLAETQNIELDTDQLLKDAADIANFDHLLALSFRWANTSQPPSVLVITHISQTDVKKSYMRLNIKQMEFTSNQLLHNS